MSPLIFLSWASRWVARQSRKPTFFCRNRYFDQEDKALIKGNMYRFLMVRSLKPQINSQRLPSFLQMNNIGTPMDDLEGHLDRMIVNAWCAWLAPRWSRERRRRCGPNTVGILTRTFLTFETELQIDATCITRLYHRHLRPPSQILLHWSVSPAWLLTTVQVLQASSLQIVCLHDWRWKTMLAPPNQSLLEESNLCQLVRER